MIERSPNRLITEIHNEITNKTRGNRTTTTTKNPATAHTKKKSRRLFFSFFFLRDRITHGRTVHIAGESAEKATEFEFIQSFC